MNTFLKEKTNIFLTGTSLSISRQKTNTRGRFYRGQSDSQRSSLCFDDPCHWDLGISPQESSGGTLMGPPSEAGTEPLDYAPLDLTRARTISKAELDSLQPVAAVSRLRLDNEEPLDLDIADVEDGHGKFFCSFFTFSRRHFSIIHFMFCKRKTD